MNKQDLIKIGSNADTKKREIDGLLEAMATYDLDEGLILTEDETDLIKVDFQSKQRKISVLPCWQWLLQ